MIARVNHVGLSVRDLEVSVAFYRDVLEMRVVFESLVEDRDDVSKVIGHPHARARLAFLDAGDSRLELWCFDHPRGRPLDPQHMPADHGFSHVAFEVPDVDQAHARVVQSGHVAVSEPTELGIHKTCYVRGPDGEIIELLEDLGSDETRLAKIMVSRRPSHDRQ